MASTPVNLFRLGNATSPRMDNVRENRDIPVHEEHGVKMVKRRTGGISTNSTRLNQKNEWELSKGHVYDDRELHINNDHGTHYLWEPEKDMTLDEFKRLLKEVGSGFNKIQQRGPGSG